MKNQTYYEYVIFILSAILVILCIKVANQNSIIVNKINDLSFKLDNVSVNRETVKSKRVSTTVSIQGPPTIKQIDAPSTATIVEVAKIDEQNNNTATIFYEGTSDTIAIPIRKVH